jgi:hypothetical protein
LPPPPYICEMTRPVCAVAVNDARPRKQKKARKSERSEHSLKAETPEIKLSGQRAGKIIPPLRRIHAEAASQLFYRSLFYHSSPKRRGKECEFPPGAAHVQRERPRFIRESHRRVAIQQHHGGTVVRVHVLIESENAGGDSFRLAANYERLARTLQQGN